MRLIIAEKPSMGRDIAKALEVTGRSQRHCIEASGLIITWSFGHLGELAEPYAYDPGLERWTLGFPTDPAHPVQDQYRPKLQGSVLRRPRSHEARRRHGDRQCMRRG